MDKFVSAKEIMQATGLSKNGVYGLFKLPGFPSVRIGKRILVSERAFMDWMERCGREQKAG